MKYAFVFIFLALGLSALAQNPASLERIESARIGLITERLKLTPQQAEKFWPVYREYAGKRQQLRRELLATRRETNGQPTEEESKHLIQKQHELKQQQVDLDKEYTSRLNEVISTQQILELRRAEEDFRQMLLERIERRRQNRERVQRHDDRNGGE